MFFLKILFAIFTLQVQIIHENAINFFFENVFFLALSTLQSSSIYKIDIAIVGTEIRTVNFRLN